MILGFKYYISVQNKIFLSQRIYTNLSDEESKLNSKYITNIMKSGTNSKSLKGSSYSFNKFKPFIGSKTTPKQV